MTKRNKAGRIVHTVESLLERAIPEPNTGCWLWTGAIAGGSGYGVVAHSGRFFGAHRLMCALAHGQIPTGHEACHRCDVRACINPAHLFAAPRSVNFADMRAKGRFRTGVGEKVRTAKLTGPLVVDMRRRAAAGEATASIAATYGVTGPTAYKVIMRMTWKHIAGDAQ